MPPRPYQNGHTPILRYITSSYVCANQIGSIETTTS